MAAPAAAAPSPLIANGVDNLMLIPLDPGENTSL